MTRLEIAEIIEKKSRALRNLKGYLRDIVSHRVKSGYIPLGNSGAKILVVKDDATYLKMKEEGARLEAELAEYMSAIKSLDHPLLTENYIVEKQERFSNPDIQMRRFLFDLVNKFHVEARQYIDNNDHAGARRCYNRAISYSIGLREKAYVNSLDWGFNSFATNNVVGENIIEAELAYNFA